MNLESLVGQTLDEKYLIERELGRGGMGAVYLSTHLGTERPVAVKVIVPQFMQRREFVERFRREARAAGRLRHPNVVDVTDFGFADTPEGRVAYLVMEYLDGCTLGEILEEEKQLPLQWTLDILEQVCSAIQEAHGQGIIHRDLKPDNIWLEPNQRGGYTVKVLDFGIAKLEASPMPPENIDRQGEFPVAENQIDISLSPDSSQKTQQFYSKQTISAESQAQTIQDTRNSFTNQAGEQRTIADLKNSKTLATEASTLIQPSAVAASPAASLSERETAIIESEAGTAILPPVADVAQSPTVKQAGEAATTSLDSGQTETEVGKTALDKNKTADLTRVGAVLGTPLYMSPEQCRGERLTAQSDIYSLGVIAYQMLSGKTPFSGDYLEVMRAHRELSPPNLEAKKVPRKVKRVINLALEKNPALRPATVEAFASSLRAYSEGIGTLFQRALVIYSQNLPKILTLTLLVYLPLVIVTVLQVVTGFMRAAGSGLGSVADEAIRIFLGLIAAFFGFLSGYLILGTIAWVVTQNLAAPLRPVSVGTAFKEVGKKWKALATTGLLSSILTLIGYSLCFFPGIYLSIIWSLLAPIVIMEGLRGKAALKRSKTLVKRSLRTATAAILMMFFVPFLMASLLTFVVSVSVKVFSEQPPVVIQKSERAGDEKTDRDEDESSVAAAPVSPAEPDNSGDEKKSPDDDITIAVNGSGIDIKEGKAEGKNMGDHLRSAVGAALTQILMLPLTIFIGSFSAVIIALLYLKTRQAGGESMRELLTQFEEADQPQSNWQRRVRERLLQSGRMTSKGASSTGGNSSGNDNIIISGQRKTAG